MRRAGYAKMGSIWTSANRRSLSGRLVTMERTFSRSARSRWTATFTRVEDPLVKA